MAASRHKTNVENACELRPDVVNAAKSNGIETLAKL
jgi:hypothetical protein